MSAKTPATARPTTVSLVLGSGGARGLAHIGVIEALTRQGYRIEAIAGSSMGALVGGIYGMGELQAYRDWVCGLDQTDIIRLLDWTLSGGGLIRGRKLIDKLRELTGDSNIEDLAVPYTAVAVDLDRGRELWMNTGPLFDAIRASIAIPGIFTPHIYRGRTLVDGGILNPVPVGPTLTTMTDLTIVVDANGPASDERTQREPSSTSESSGPLDRLRKLLSGDSDASSLEGPPGFSAVLTRSLETMQTALTRHHLAVYRPDLVIQIPRNACMVHEFHRAKELIALGHEATETALAHPGTPWHD